MEDIHAFGADHHFFFSLGVDHGAVKLEIADNGLTNEHIATVIDFGGEDFALGIRRSDQAFLPWNWDAINDEDILGVRRLEDVLNELLVGDTGAPTQDS